ncbi:hypothetical protein C8R48DRAFT_679943 [Suillus tomentosus]|nr:hypothetical protein C8R48DRAFT_679943 [Suillus tomentosus]
MARADNTGSSRSIRSAKQKAMENAVWMTTKSQQQRPTGGKLTQAPVQRKTHVSTGATKRHDGRSSVASPHVPEIPGPVARKRPGSLTKKRRVAKPHAVSDDELLSDEISEFQPGHDDSEQENNLDMEDIDDELEEPIDSVVKSLSTEKPIFVSMSKAEQADFPLTQATWPRTTASKKSRQIAEPFPFVSTQPRTRAVAPQKAKIQSARDRKRADEMPVWADGIAESDKELEEIMVPDESNDLEGSQEVDFEGSQEVDFEGSQEVDFEGSQEVDLEGSQEVDLEGSQEVDLDYHDSGLTRHGRPGSARLVRTNTGKLKLMDQDIDTRRVVQRAILEAKVHVTFVNGYPELTEKSLFTRNPLLTAARACGVPIIQDRLKSDDSYVTALATLVTAYYRLASVNHHVLCRAVQSCTVPQCHSLVPSVQTGPSL